jgi:hypothetical protein
VDSVDVGLVDYALIDTPTDAADLIEQAGTFWAGPCARDGVELHLQKPHDAADAAAEAAVVLRVRDGGPGLSDDDVRVALERGALNERYRQTRPVVPRHLQRRRIAHQVVQVRHPMGFLVKRRA